MKPKLTVLERNVATLTKDGIEYICITDIARYKNSERTDDLIRNWLRSRNIIECLGIWERLNNPAFKSVEFDGFKKEAGLKSSTLTPKQWRESNSDTKGNMRDHANLHQLVCLANLESLNAHIIEQKKGQSERLVRLNEVAIRQMQILLSNENALMLQGDSNNG
ncbi:KilA-N domain-containing protein [Methylophaga sulfidovorans]|uniref:KilA-N domain-containing protein n=1 Tax=Methylophaga sulfidovorans TaxID=45496 RepID=A0A1I3VG44_9GAMM|nr:KilA-N domain-containing protein [Methylophaga sulfidovorans]SFJ93979.1 KilA-N domain-containing protein [Methylophaga sulfidovorans]